MRQEFTKATKRAALLRSGLKCEAIGLMYGLEEGVRCNCTLSMGVQYDHELACSNGGDNSLENCKSVCLKCHSIKSRLFDTPRAAKIKRVSDKAKGIRTKSALSSTKSPKPPLTKTLPPRALFGERS